MLRIAVVNDKKNILPCSFDAGASIYEYEDGEMKNTGVRRSVKGLIEMQRCSHVSIYPPDEEDVRAMHRRIDELVCGGIEDYLRVALERMGISVMRNVYGSMDTFAKDYLEGTLKKTEPGETRRADAQDLLEFTRIVWDDYDDIRIGYEQLDPKLSKGDKLWLLDQWAENEREWDIFNNFIRLFDVPIDLQRALKYVNRFMVPEREYMNRRYEDMWTFQSIRLFRIQLVINSVEPEAKKQLIDEAFITAVKNRWILIVEYLMDQGADIFFGNKHGESVARCETRMIDLTMLDYLDVYRRTGKKKDIDTKELFIQRVSYFDSVYTPEIGVPGIPDVTDYLDRNVGEAGKKIFEKYSKTVLLEEMSSWDLLDLINRYDWTDGPGVPHLVAVHPLCTKELIRKMFIFGEKKLERARYGDIESIRLWRCFLSELCHIHEAMK